MIVEGGYLSSWCFMIAKRERGWLQSFELLQLFIGCDYSLDALLLTFEFWSGTGRDPELQDKVRYPSMPNRIAVE